MQKSEPHKVLKMLAQQGLL